MIKMILNGANGKMGQAVMALVATKENTQIVYGADMDKPICDAPKNADVILDFSISNALDGILDFARENKIPLVLATTGYSEAQLDKIKLASQNIPILRSATMSIGANLLMKLARETAEILGEDFDAEILEKHHNMKVDAPSGVAYALAEEIASVRPGSEYIFDRTTQRKPRAKSEIGISSIRGGTIVGEHTVIFAGPHEVIELTHKSESREIFAHGALRAAEFIVGKNAGLYSMADVIQRTINN